MNKKENEVRLNIKITKDLLAAVKELAAKKGLTISALTRFLLVSYLEQETNGQRSN